MLLGRLRSPFSSLLVPKKSPKSPFSSFLIPGSSQSHNLVPFWFPQVLQVLQVTLVSRIIQSHLLVFFWSPEVSKVFFWSRRSPQSSFNPQKYPKSPFKPQKYPKSPEGPEVPKVTNFFSNTPIIAGGRATERVRRGRCHGSSPWHECAKCCGPHKMLQVERSGLPGAKRSTESCGDCDQGWYRSSSSQNIPGLLRIIGYSKTKRPPPAVPHRLDTEANHTLSRNELVSAGRKPS